VFAYPMIALPHYWKTFQTIGMRGGEYIRALRPALDSSIAMILTVVIFQWTVHTIHSTWIYLIVEISIGATAYVGTLAVLHRDRMQYFLSFAQKLKGSKDTDSKQPAKPETLEPVC